MILLHNWLLKKPTLPNVFQIKGYFTGIPAQWYCLNCWGSIVVILVPKSVTIISSLSSDTSIVNQIPSIPPLCPPPLGWRMQKPSVVLLPPRSHIYTEPLIFCIGRTAIPCTCFNQHKGEISFHQFDQNINI